MLPKGAAHIPRASFSVIALVLNPRPRPPDSIFAQYRHTDKGTAKIARDLGMDYAEAVVRV